MKKLDIRDYLQATSGVKGWFFPIDASLFGAVDEIQKLEGIRGNLFEIGVHHGKSTVLLSRMARADESIGACDIFENQDLNKDASGKGNLEIFRANVRAHSELGQPGRAGQEALNVFAKSSEALSLEDTGECRFFHIDGGHWPEIVMADLATAERALVPGGVIAVDDVFNPNWPGVGEGFYRFMRENPGKLAPLIIGANKVFLARPGFVATFKTYCSPPQEFARLIDTGPFSFEDKGWMGEEVLTVIRHSWVDISPVRAALSHMKAARGVRQLLGR